MANSNQYNLLADCQSQIAKLKINKILIAYSGGLDSSVLLDCLYKISLSSSISIRTIHINHNLSPQSIIFENHCSEITSKMKIDHQNIKINIDSLSNIEEQCRKKRYLSLTKSCRQDEIIFTAHHEADQVETFFLRLIRGSGARGLSSMKNKSIYDKKIIYRPFLNISKQIIEDYCKGNNIDYIEDHSNHDNKYDRNFIRNNLIPLIKSRWPSINKNILNNISVQDIQSKCLVKHISNILPNYQLNNDNELSVAKLNQEPIYNKIMIIHEWVFMRAGVSLNLKQIREVLKILDTNNDSNPLFKFDQIEITKTKDILLLTSYIR